MRIEKIETNYKRNLYFQTRAIKADKYKETLENQIINIYPNIKAQEFIGFGGAITQAAGVAYQKLPKEKQISFINEYFTNYNYSLCRIPIGSCDFSPEMYSYSNKKDLIDFSIEKDEMYIIPLLKDILKVKTDLELLASPWSPPSFMKSNKMLTYGGKLEKKYYSTYAFYLLKYIQAYQNIGINIDFMTVQNEPNVAQTWESCLFSTDEELDFLKNYLYPTFKENRIKTKILIYDHNKEKLYSRAEKIFKNCPEADGIAYHWYTGDHFDNIDICRHLFPNKLLIHTEGCVGYSSFNPNDEIKNAEMYAHDIMGDLNYGSNGYIDWNILLDYYGGPNHKKNYCNSPIMLNENESDYYKNLCYYYIGQFSKVIKLNAERIAFSKYTDNIEVTAFENKDKSIAIVLLNRNDKNYEYNLCMNDIWIHDNLDSHAIVSYLIY